MLASVARAGLIGSVAIVPVLSTILSFVSVCMRDYLTLLLKIPH